MKRQSKESNTEKSHRLLPEELYLPPTQRILNNQAEILRLLRKGK